MSSGRFFSWRKKEKLNKEMPILKLSQPDPDREIEFELAYLKSLTAKQRFQMMFKKTEELRRLLKIYGNRKITQIVKRT